MTLHAAHKGNDRKPGGPGGHRSDAHGAVGALGAAVITVSTTRTEKTDASGKFLAKAFEGAGHKVLFYRVVKDDLDEIQAAVRAAIQTKGVHVIVTSGGTGMGRADVTIEAVLPLLDKRADGWGDTFRAVSRDEIGTAAFLSRSVAGVAGGKWVVSIPGSLGAAKTAMKKLLLPELEHMVWETRR